MKRSERIIALLGFVALTQACSSDEHLVGPPAARRVKAEKRHFADDDQPRYSDWSTPVNLGPVVNSSANEQHPAISRDGRSLYVSSDRPGGLGMLDIWVSHRESVDAPWGALQNLGPNINSAGMDLAPAFTPDGHRMYFHSFGRGGCGLADIFVARRHSRRDDLGWQPAENLGCVVNSAYRDAGPTYFEDEATGITTLYLTVQNNPPGADQGWDIYASTRVGDEGDFGPPALVPELSSPFRDTRTAIRRDGLEIFLSTGRPGGVGGEDVWVATRATTQDAWSQLVPLGPVVNSAGFDGAPALSSGGTELYFFSDRPGGYGKNDLYVSTRTRIKD